MQLSNKIYSFRIQPQDVDFQYHATMAAMTNILLTTAGYNADDNGFGIRDLNNIDCSWVLLRLAVEMYCFPKQYEKIQVETWVEEVGRASTTRNFLIRNEQDEMIGKASSNWAMININTRRAQDMISLNGIHKHATGVPISMEKPIKLGLVEGNPVDVFKVKYSDIDINGHTNSMRYVEWISDCFSLDVYRQKQIKRFEINYVNEILFDEEISIFVNETEKNDFRFEIRKEGKTACRARMVLTEAS
ncbi:MAG: acyl-[acyl-carrier-protein] thioesterase [Bacteroidales bacterium]|nr:acyl-[acyl-carrier-protein] thioesterase [Bacteroidales bacterium]